MKTASFAAALVPQLLASAAWAQSPQNSTTVPAPPAETLASDTAANEETPVGAEAPTDDIVVTAQRRTQRLQDVPIAVAVVDSAQIENTGLTDTTQLGAVVPGLAIQHTFGSFQPAIRGISTSSNVVENAVALYIDGVYLPNSRDGLRDLADIEQISVLKGPQGTLFGRNATAGVIQITTRRPSQNLKAEFKIGVDNYETVRSSAYVTGGLAENLAASLSASYTTQGEGWGESLTTGMELYKLKKNLSLRTKLLFTPGDRTELTLIGDYLDREDTGRSYQPYPGTNFAYPGFGPVTSRYDSYSATPGYNRFKSRGVSLEVNHDLDFAKFVSITSYRRGNGGFRFDFTSVAIPFVIPTAVLNNESYTQEVQLVSPNTGNFQWVVGAYYFHNETAYPDFERRVIPPFGPPTVRSVNTNAAETAKSISPFAQVDYEFAPETTLTLGARYTYEKRRIEGFNSLNFVNGTSLIQPVPADNTLELKKPTYRVAVNHNFTRDIAAYVSYNRGIKSGGFNIATPQSPAYREELLDAFEVGLKTQFFDRRLTFNSSAFLYKYRNLQVLTFIGDSPTPILTNGAKAEIYGLDADFRARVTNDLSLSGGFQILKSEFTDYPSAPISTPRPTGGALIVNGSATGNRLPLAQEFVATLAVDYDKQIGGLNTHFNVTGTYNSDYYFEPDNFLRQPSYFNLNASLRIADAADRLSATFGVTNILDEAVIANIGTQSFAYFANYGFPPRLYTLTLGARF